MTPYGVTLAEGPLYATQRVHIPSASHGPFNYEGSYVEIRQERTPHGILWEIEHGSNRFGHAGTWGRDNAADAFRTFAHAVAFEAREY